MPPTSESPAVEDPDVFSFLTDLVLRCDPCISSCCNGLFCVASASILSKTIVICNPAMRELRLLPPPPPSPSPSPSPSHQKPWRTNRLGFGFGPNTRDYKLLRLATRHDERLRIVEEKVQLYDLGTDSWREAVVSASLPKEKIWRTRFWTSLNGVFYWLAYPPDAGPEAVVAFCLFDELFERIPLPDVSLQSSFNLLTLHDSLALVVFANITVSLEDSRIVIWVMEDGYGVGKKENNWTKKYTIGPNLSMLGLSSPLGFLQDGELLLVRYHDKKMVSYNFNAGEIEEYEVYVGLHPASGWQFLGYAESLVSVKRRVVG